MPHIIDLSVHLASLLVFAFVFGYSCYYVGRAIEHYDIFKHWFIEFFDFDQEEVQTHE